jgi:hypothetical protein
MLNPHQAAMAANTYAVAMMTNAGGNGFQVQAGNGRGNLGHIEVGYKIKSDSL